MNPELTRWNDDRLDDFHRAFGIQSDALKHMAQLEIVVDGMKEDVGECKAGIQKLHDIRSEERKERAEEQRERRRIFYAILGAIFGAAGLVVAAIGLFVG